MPVMNGLEAAAQIWEKLGDDAPRIVAVSASTLDHERQEFLDAGFDSFIPKPFETAQIYACLANLLGVEFDYAEAAPEEAPLDLKAIQIPDDLLGTIRRAAEMSSVTELEQALREVESIGGEAARLAAKLRELSQDFKMDEILGILEEIRT